MRTCRCSVPEGAENVQVWLQDFAWTEKQKPAQLKQRVAQAKGEHERLILEQAPLFCVETAICLHRFSNLVYESALHAAGSLLRTVRCLPVSSVRASAGFNNLVYESALHAVGSLLRTVR